MPGWSDVLNQVLSQPGNLDNIRRQYITQLSDYTGRNVIVYYSGWLTSKNSNIDINDGDMIGFMNAVKDLDKAKGLDLIIHTPGGSPTATEGILNYLHSIFGNNIRSIIPHMAMSAGTLMACSTSVIFMGKQSCLGPVDPQFNGIAAYNIVKELEKAQEELALKPETREYWRLQLAKYPAAFTYTVYDAIELSGQLLTQWLGKYMFGSLKSKKKKSLINKIVKGLNLNDGSHARHYDYEKCKELGLNVKLIEEDQVLQDLVLSVYHSFSITAQTTSASKIIENQIGKAFISHQQSLPPQFNRPQQDII